MAKHQFQTEVNQLLHLMIHSLYSNKEIFLRELISNASDAMDKLQFLTITDDNYKKLEFNPRILITFDKEAKTVTISDSGIGMNSEDLVENLGTIAKSGTKSFLENLTGDAKKDSNLIGQFGVGFYSAFMVANKIEVTSKKAGEEGAYKWISEGDGSYEIVEASKDSFGTEIVLHLKDDEDEFLSEFRIKGIVEKYSNHIPFAIDLKYMGTETIPAPEPAEGEEPKEPETKEVEKCEQINKASALWRMSKSELKSEDYNDFYKTIAHDSEEPLLYSHNRVEGTLEYTTLFYVPKKAPFDMFRVDYQPGVKLYIQRVFITDDEKELMPTYLRFLKGVIDSEDLPLNVSREILQHNRVLEKIKTNSVKKVLGEFKKLAEKDKEKYTEFWNEYGRVLKEGLYSDFANKETLLELMRFKSLNSDGLISLAEYKDAMKVDQKEIYFITGEDENVLKNSPLLEAFKEKGMDVLILSDEVDAIVMPSVTDYKETPIKPIQEAKFEEKDIDVSEFDEIIGKIKDILKDEIKDVKISQRLSHAPSCITFDANDPDYQMQKMLQQMGQMGASMPKVKPILEVNPKSEIFIKLKDNSELDADTFNDIANLLLDQAKMLEGGKLENIVEFNARLNRVMAKAL